MNAETQYILESFLPEMALAALGVLVLLVDLLLPKANARKAVTLIAAVGALCVGGLAALQWQQAEAAAVPAFVQQELSRVVARAQQDLQRDHALLDRALRLPDTQSAFAMELLTAPAAPPAAPAEAAALVTNYRALQRDVPGLAPLNLGIGHPGVAVWWLFANDRFAAAFKVIFALALFLVLLLSVRFPVERYRGEFVALLIFAAFGLMIMVGTRDLIILFLGLELASICLYVLTAWHKADARSAEAGTKYLLLASLASAFYIYGASLLFVKFGTTHLGQLALSLPTARLEPLVLLGLIMLLVGFSFKVAAAPFHLWAPDVYQGAPISTVAFLATASKAAGFAVLIRVLATGFLTAHAQWWQLMAVMAALSMLVGNLIALHQNDVKRLLAYSGIAQAGYVLLAVMALGLAGSTANPEQSGVMAAVLYLFLYVVGNIGVFAITGIVGRETGSTDMAAFAGLRWRAPLLAFCMALLLLSLGGIPLLAGFVGKWFLFMAGVYQGQYLLVILGAALSVVSIYYYLLIIKQMYIKPAAEGAPPIRAGVPAAVGLGLIAAFTLAIGIYPAPFLALAERTALALMGQ